VPNRWIDLVVIVANSLRYQHRRDQSAEQQTNFQYLSIFQNRSNINPTNTLLLLCFFLVASLVSAYHQAPFKITWNKFTIVVRLLILTRRPKWIIFHNSRYVTMERNWLYSTDFHELNSSYKKQYRVLHLPFSSTSRHPLPPQPPTSSIIDLNYINPSHIAPISSEIRDQLQKAEPRPRFLSFFHIAARSSTTATKTSFTIDHRSSFSLKIGSSSIAFITFS
jgi:hypothetical protein